MAKGRGTSEQVRQSQGERKDEGVDQKPGGTPTSHSSSSSGSGWSVLTALISDNYKWIRGVILLVLGGCVVLLVIAVSTAIVVGAEVTLWPPHIAAHDPPDVRKCHILADIEPQRTRVV
jgi:hypothetical protein